MSRGFFMTPDILTVTLNPAIDRIIRRDGPLSVQSSFAGGKGVNVARALEALNVPARSIGVAGGPAGRLLQEYLDQEKINHIFLPIKGSTRTNLTMIGRDGVVRRKIEFGPVMTKKERVAFAALFCREIRPFSTVVFAGSLPLKFPIRDFLSLVTSAQHSGSAVVVDTHGLALKAALGLAVDCIKPNQKEAEEVLGFKLSSRARMRKALRTFIGYGIKKVLISLGPEGLVASDGQKELWVRTPVVSQGHAVGCGDAALAGFLSADVRSKNFQTCVAYAAACGYANMLCGVPGKIVKKNIQYALSRRKLIWL
jgi:1-phosphofructokinase family hexose kinase